MMKLSCFKLIGLLTLGLFFVSAEAQDSFEDYLLPEVEPDQTIYVQKFSPVYIQNLSAEEIDLIKYGSEGKDSLFFKSELTEEEQRLLNSKKKKGVKNFRLFLEILNNYNLVLYRKFNEYIENSIDDLANGNRFKPIYVRDFNESNDTNIRFIIINDFSLVDIFADLQNEESRTSADNKFNSYLLDKKSGKKYKNEFEIGPLLSKLDYYFTLENKGKVKSMDREEIDAKLTKYQAKPQRSGSSNSVVMSVLLLSAISVIFNYL